MILGALTLPIIKLALPALEWRDIIKLFETWEYWLWLAVMVVSQFALLIVPVRFASRRPVTKGALWPTLVAGALMIGGLAFGAACALGEFAFHDHGGSWVGWGVIALGVLFWCIWLLIFFRMSKRGEATDFVTRQCRVLLKGSILELLIAVPTHLVARERNYCCAGFMTFIGLTMGISVMLFSFGPAVFFLYADRWKRLQPKRSGTELANELS